jgi:hypothetical protein
MAALASACAPKTAGDDPICPASLSRCDSNIYQTCSDDGTKWTTVADCGAQGLECILNTGCRACSPGSRLCGANGFDIILCRADGSGYDTASSCDPDQAMVCSDGVCMDACTLSTATRSYSGCEYWAVDLDNAVIADDGAAAAQQYAVVVANPLEVPADVTVSVNDAPQGMPREERVVATAHLARIEGGGDLATILLPDRGVDGASDPRLNDGPGTWLSSRAYHITSTAPIVAYQFNPLSNVQVFSNDASLLLPSTALDGEYMVLAWPQTIAITDMAETNWGINLRAFLTIVGMHEDTTVHVTLSATAVTVGGGPIPAGMPGDTLTFNIGPYDVINLETDGFNADFTGTTIDADAPVTVFAGSEASDVPFWTSSSVRQCCADHMEEQEFPLSALGTQFVAVKTPSRTRYARMAGYQVALVEDEQEWWRVLGTKPNTLVTTNLPPPNDHFTLQAGESVTWFTGADFVLNATSAVAFGQFPGGQQTTGIPIITGQGGIPGGDPSFITVPPVAQWRTKYVFLIPDKYEFDSILLAVSSTSSVLLDGANVRDLTLDAAADAGVLDQPRCEYATAGDLTFKDGTTTYVAIRCVLSNPRADDYGDPIYQNDGRHVVESTDGQRFGLIVRGWDNHVAYGYPGGADVKIVNIQ